MRTVSEETFEAFLESAPDAMLVVGENGDILLANSQAEKLFGYETGELNGKEIEMLVPPAFRANHRDYRTKYFNAPVLRPMGVALDLQGVRRDGSLFPVEISLSPMTLAGRKVVASAIRDTTERKRIEEKLRRSLQEKEILLKEVHHRVKNNLQMISSLLNLQARLVDDEKAREIFNDSRARVRSFALLHEKLYQSQDLAKIDFEDYVKDLASALFQSTGMNSERVTLEVNMEQVVLDMDSIINCGLIVSELVTNSLKYAFPAGRSGSIRITLRTIGAGTLELTVQDDGAGLPNDLDYRKSNTLGLQLVGMFAKELGGALHFSNPGSGTRVSVEFPATQLS